MRECWWKCFVSLLESSRHRNNVLVGVVQQIVFDMARVEVVDRLQNAHHRAKRLVMIVVGADDDIRCSDALDVLCGGCEREW